MPSVWTISDEPIRSPEPDELTAGGLCSGLGESLLVPQGPNTTFCVTCWLAAKSPFEKEPVWRPNLNMWREDKRETT